MNPAQTSIASNLDLPGYLLGGFMLLVVMVFHGVLLLQIAKRYEVKTFLYLAEKKYSTVAACFYISVFFYSSPTLQKFSFGVSHCLYLN